MKKETTKKSKLWIIILAALLLIGGVVGGIFAFGGFGGGNEGEQEPGPVVTGPRADLYWNLDREFYTKDSQTGLSTREADANGQFKIRFAYNGEIVELVIIDKKLVNIIDTQDVMGLTFDENGVVIGQINVRELATETGKKVYVKKATAEAVYANSSMAMNGMELTLKIGQYAEIYDLRPDSETFGKKIAPTDLQVMDCVTVYSNAEGDVTHIYLHSSGERSKIYWRANLWVSDSINKGGLDPDENGIWTLPYYCEGELVQIRTKDAKLVEYYAEQGVHSGFHGLKFDDDGFAIDVMDAAIGVAGQRTFYALDVVEINGNYVKLKNYWTTSGLQAWEGEIPADVPIYNVSSWAYSEGVMGQTLHVTDLQVGDRITMFSDMEGNPLEIGLTLRRVDLKPMFNNSAKYDAATRSTTRVKDEDGYWTYTFIDEKGIHKYKTKDQKLATFIDSYPERVFGIVTKGDKILKAYEYNCLYGYTRFSTALYVDSINGTIISASDQKKANAYTAVLSEDYKVLDISGDSKQWGQKIELQLGDCMISFRNINKEVCMIYVTKRSQGGKLYVNTTPDTSRDLVTKDKDGKPLAENAYYWEYDMTDINGKQVKLTLAAGKKDKDGVYANKYLQSRIDSASKGIIALEVSGTKIKDAHAVANMASGNSVNPVYITKAGTEEFEYKTVAKPNDEANIYPGWTGSEGLKMINLTVDVKSHYGEKLSGGMKVNDVYYMVRNRANETVAMFLISRGLHNDLFFVKDNYGIVNGVTTRPVDAEGYYVFNVMYAGKPAKVRTKDVNIATSLEGKRSGAALKLDKTDKKNIVLAVTDYTGTGDAYSQLASNWDVSKISGKKVTLQLNIPTTSTEVGETKEFNLGSAKVYNISPNAGEEFGKITKLQKNDRVRVYTDKNGNVSYVLVTVRNGLKTEMCEHCGKKVTWNPLTATSGMGTGSAHYYVYDNMDVYGQWSVSGDNTNKYDVVIDLNGKTVFNKSNNSRTFQVVYPNKTLTLMDSVGTGKAMSYGWDSNAGLIQVAYGGNLVITGGTYELLPILEGMKPTKQGGVIFSWNDTSASGRPDYRNTVTIKGGTIIGGDVQHPDRTNGNDPQMTKKWSYGGTIYAQFTDVTVSGGVIKGGLADRGGNIYLGNNATLKVTGGEITEGQARNRGGNIFGETGSVITVDGGKVTNGKVLVDYILEYEENGETKQKYTGQQGGNIAGYKVNLLSGEISGGVAKTTGGNIFLLGYVSEKKTVNGEEVTEIVDSNAFVMTGGKLANGTAASGGGNFYVWGNEGVALISGGEIDASGFTIGNDGNLGAAMKVTGGKVGAVSIAAKCGIIVGGDAQIDYLSLNKDALPMGIEELSETAKIYVAATGNFAKAAVGFETLDISAYAGKQIAAADVRLGIISCTTVDSVKWLTYGTKDMHEIYTQAPAKAVQMTTDGVFNAGGTVTTYCPACDAEATWTPLTADMTALAEGHYYLAENITRTDNKRFTTSAGTVCVHLNGKEYHQGATASSEGAFKAGNGATLILMGDGIVTGYGSIYSSSTETNYMGGAVDARGEVIILGGTYYSTAADRPAVGTWNGTGNITMYAGTIQGAPNADGVTAEGSSSVRVRAGAFTMYGGTITGGKGKYGGNVAINGGTFTMNGGTITAGTGYRGGNVYAAGGTFNLVDGTISDGSVTNNLGGNFYITSGTVNVSGGAITGGTSPSSGGSIGMNGIKGALNVSGGTISGGTAAASGGLIYVYNSNLTISGGELKEGTAKDGALIGVDAANTGVISITGGTFVGGQASRNGGLFQLSSNATITGGTFTNGTAATAANGINMGNNKTLAISGITGELDVKLNTNNTLTIGNGAQVNVEFTNATSKLVLADDLVKDETVITIAYAADDEAALTEANAKAAQYIADGIVVSANPARPVVANSDNQIFVASMQTSIDNLGTLLNAGTTEAYCPVCGELATWSALTKTTTTLDGADAPTHYYLADNVTREDGSFIRTTGSSGSVTCLFLNGKTYNQGTSGTTNQGAITVNAGTTMNIFGDGLVTGTGIQYPYANNATPTLFGGGAIDVRGTVNIYGGTYKAANVGPAVACFAANGATVNMYGGNITKGDAITNTDSAISSNVRLYDASHVFNMYGGTITGGMATNGGNVRMQGGAFNLAGGTISGGEATNLGGNICVRGGTFTMTGGEVKDADIVGNNNNNASGGNFGLVSGTLNIQGGVVTNGKANNGGMVYVYGGTLSITGGEISNNVGSGGAVLIAGGTNTITGGKALTIGKTLAAKIYAGGTVTAQNGTVATVELAAAGRIAFAADVAEGTKVTVVAAATQTIATMENAANFLGYFESGVEGATIAVAEGTNDIVITVPVAE